MSPSPIKKKEHRTDVLFTRVSYESKKKLIAKAKELGYSTSEYLDLLIKEIK